MSTIRTSALFSPPAGGFRFSGRRVLALGLLVLVVVAGYLALFPDAFTKEVQGVKLVIVSQVIADGASLPPFDPNGNNHCGDGALGMTTLIDMVVNQGYGAIAMNAQKTTVLIRVVGETVWITGTGGRLGSTVYMGGFTKGEFDILLRAARGTWSVGKITDILTRAQGVRTMVGWNQATKVLGWDGICP